LTLMDSEAMSPTRTYAHQMAGFKEAV
jgi:hypothetical protein